MIPNVINLLYAISQALLGPLLLVLLALGVFTVFQSGQIIREGLDRWWWNRSWRTLIRQLKEGRTPNDHWRDTALASLPAMFARDLPRDQCSPGLTKKVVEDISLEVTRRLSRQQIGIRVGPMIGLVGTLIPLGPALEALTVHDYSSIGRHLTVAFTTTIFGILIGGANYAFLIIRRQWYEKDLSDIEFLMSHLAGDNIDVCADSTVEASDGRRSLDRTSQLV